MDMQDSTRETTRFYVQWYDRNRAQWRTPTDEHNHHGWDTAEMAALAGVPEVLQLASKTNPPTCRIIRRTVTETVED